MSSDPRFVVDSVNARFWISIVDGKPTRKDQSNGAADYEQCVICNRDRAFLRRSARPRITPHEAARLQMLPDFVTFRDAPSRGAIAKMIGNCVPPALGIAIGS